MVKRSRTESLTRFQKRKTNELLALQWHNFWADKWLNYHFVTDDSWVHMSERGYPRYPSGIADAVVLFGSSSLNLYPLVMRSSTVESLILLEFWLWLLAMRPRPFSVVPIHHISFYPNWLEQIFTKYLRIFETFITSKSNFNGHGNVINDQWQCWDKPCFRISWPWDDDGPIAKMLSWLFLPK